MEARIIEKYFEIDNEKRLRFERLKALYLFWNERVNVISRKDIDHLYERHVLHSLAVAKVVDLGPNARVLDIGTGGGFPGIPLAVMFPQTQFVLTDSIGKKIKVVQAVAEELQLKNVTALHIRSEKAEGKFDFAVSRAVTDLKTQWNWIREKLKSENRHAIPNGFIGLKGGDLSDEIKSSKLKTRIYRISDFFDEPFFETKKIVTAHR